jgi:hypothetical protein
MKGLSLPSVLIIVNFVHSVVGEEGTTSFLELLEGFDFSNRSVVGLLIGVSLLLVFIDFSWEVFNDAINYVSVID